MNLVSRAAEAEHISRREVQVAIPAGTGSGQGGDRDPAVMDEVVKSP